MLKYKQYKIQKTYFEDLVTINAKLNAKQKKAKNQLIRVLHVSWKPKRRRRQRLDNNV